MRDQKKTPISKKIDRFELFTSKKINETLNKEETEEATREIIQQSPTYEVGIRKYMKMSDTAFLDEARKILNDDNANFLENTWWVGCNSGSYPKSQLILMMVKRDRIEDGYKKK